MQSFLEETLLDLASKYEDLSKLTLVFPSKRAGAFFQRYLLKHTTKTQFSPTIVSIEQFIEEIAQLKIIDPTELLFKGYAVYKDLPEVSEPESFENYLNWAQTILNDFNEMDRYLVPQEAFFSYLSAIQDMEHWYVQEERTEMIENYLAFWKLLPSFYELLNDILSQESIGYQGMVYRKAVEDVEHYLTARTNPVVFIGFNALNTAEQRLIQSFLTKQENTVYWDIDPYFFEDTHHSASHFIRSYVTTWHYFETNPISLPKPSYAKPKRIQAIAAQKNISQVQTVGALLAELTAQQSENTAVVLADESLLVPLLYALPESIESVNVTMGVSLQQFPLYRFFEVLIHLHVSPKTTYYYKEVFQIINHPVSRLFLSHPEDIKNPISLNNLSSVSLADLVEMAHAQDKEWVQVLFQPWESSATVMVDTIIQLLVRLKDATSLARMDRIVLYEIYQLILKIKGLSEHFDHIKNPKTLLQLFQELAANQRLDFEGDAYQGLQIMGLLETRCLDFENIIMLSVNEGILPAGKSNASFITYDMKKTFELPLYTEKDAIYTYHFYRLLQRADNISLLYNSFAEGLGSGEKSRFLLQLEIDGHPNHKFTQKIADPEVGVHEISLKQIDKTPKMMKRIAAIATKGFSPSALTSYIRNPLEFYYQKILQIQELEEVEETVAYNTLGTIVHNALETLYSPLVGSRLSVTALKSALHETPNIIQQQFEASFQQEHFQRGKNLIIYQVAQRYVENLIRMDITTVQSGSELVLLGVEESLAMDWPLQTVPHTISLRGIVDRIDRLDGTLRIIDYKTGRVTPTDLYITHWEDVKEDYKYSKAFQVLVYATLLQNNYSEETVSAGIISFKNLQEGYMPFAKKEPGSRAKDTAVTPPVLASFGSILSEVIQEICEVSQPIIEKELA